jgi:hypothetical protein
MNCNFMKFYTGMKVTIPIRGINEDMAVPFKKGAFFLQVVNTVNVRAMSPEIPAYIDVDLGAAKGKEVFRASRLIFPNTVMSYPMDSNLSIGTVVTK